jgi:hypothetical protein
MKPTYRSLNKRMVICSCDRSLFLAGLFVGVGMFMTLGNFTFGLIIFAVFATMGWCQARDPVLLRLMLSFNRQCVQFDPAKVEPFPVIIYGKPY